MPPAVTTELGPVLLRLARRAIEGHLGLGRSAPRRAADCDPAMSVMDGMAAGIEESALPAGIATMPDEPLGPGGDPRLAERGATFVTLKRDGALRGCIGSLRPQRALGEDVAANAIAAATADPRFPPLTADELAEVRIEVSLLSSPQFLDFADEGALLDQLRPGVDGLILFSGCRSATFLPQVWEELPDRHRFLATLKQKAGLAPDCPARGLLAATYTVTKWAESDAAAAAG